MRAAPAARKRGVRSPQPEARAADLVRGAALPWFPFLSPGVQLKLCRANLASGEMVLMIRLEPGAAVGMHYHHGIVVAYTIEGRWRYRDADWEAGAGDVIIQPAGSRRALENATDTPAVAFVHLRGALEFLDDAGRTLCIENAETLHGRYLAFCALHGLEPIEVATR